MTKTLAPIPFRYTYDPARPGAHYTLNGVNWMNGGDFAEAALKATLGLPAVKDANTAYDVASDIPELSASVKSSKATLVNKVLGESFAEVKARYFQNVVSTAWVWVSIQNETVISYSMNEAEFDSFMTEWASFDSKRKVIRFKAESLKMLNWLESKVA